MRKLVINFLLKKYEQNEAALIAQPYEPLLLARKEALIKLILLDTRKNRRRGKLNVWQ